MLFFGIKGKIELDRRIKGYAVTEGYLIDTEVYIERSTSTRRHRSNTYQLTYIYEVDGQEYTVKTDYGTGSVPALGSAKEIYYNPKAPQEAVISGTNSRIHRCRNAVSDCRILCRESSAAGHEFLCMYSLYVYRSGDMDVYTRIVFRRKQA